MSSGGGGAEGWWMSDDGAGGARFGVETSIGMDAEKYRE